MTIDELREKITELDEEYKNASVSTKRRLHEIADKYEFIYNLLIGFGIAQSELGYILDSYYNEYVGELRRGEKDGNNQNSG
jgi:hypothetical protein